MPAHIMPKPCPLGAVVESRPSIHPSDTGDSGNLRSSFLACVTSFANSWHLWVAMRSPSGTRAVWMRLKMRMMFGMGPEIVASALSKLVFLLYNRVNKGTKS